MNETYEDKSLSRRNFIRAAALTAVAAAATGGGAALMKKQQVAITPPPVSQLAPTIPLPQNNVAAAVNTNATEMLSRLAESQVENMRLEAMLAATQRQVDALQQELAGKGSATEQLTVELANVTQQAGLLAGLVALYEQLDDVDVATAWQEGVTAVSESLSSWLSEIPTLDEGIELGQQALDKLESHIPLLENGRIWLNGQRDKLQLYYQAIEALLTVALELSAPFLEMISEWFQKIHRWLPFNIGQQATNIMTSITTLLAETPHTISGLHTNVAQPLDIWLQRDGDKTLLQRDLVQPIRLGVLEKAKGVAAKAQQVETVYETKLVTPAQTAVTNQQALRTEIAHYREMHQI